MALSDQTPSPERIADCHHWLAGIGACERDTLYRQFWKFVRALDDQYSEEADQYWATLFAIEEVRQYNRGEVNAIRFG